MKKKEKKNIISHSWSYLKRDTWDSWLVSILLVFIIIKFIFFPGLSLITGSSLPLVVIESCSMYHETNLDDWWFKNAAWYENKNITESEFRAFPFTNGLNKGDIILVWGHDDYEKGDIIIFNAPTRYPLIHRIISDPAEVIATKGDHNLGQLEVERDIPEGDIRGKAVVRIPALGWLKLIFFEPFRPAEQRGLC